MKVTALCKPTRRPDFPSSPVKQHTPGSHRPMRRIIGCRRNLYNLKSIRISACRQPVISGTSKDDGHCRSCKLLCRTGRRARPIDRMAGRPYGFRHPWCTRRNTSSNVISNLFEDHGRPSRDRLRGFRAPARQHRRTVFIRQSRSKTECRNNDCRSQAAVAHHPAQGTRRERLYRIDLSLGLVGSAATVPPRNERRSGCPRPGNETGAAIDAAPVVTWRGCSLASPSCARFSAEPRPGDSPCRPSEGILRGSLDSLDSFLRLILEFYFWLCDAETPHPGISGSTRCASCASDSCQPR